VNGAVRAAARHELGRRWRSLLVIGVVAGVLGGALLGATVLTRRTDSAPDRLAAAVDPGDVRVDLYGSALADDIASLPEVAASAAAQIAVGHLRGPGFVYLGMLVPEDRDPALVHLVVLDGRAPDADAPDEVVLTEEAAESLGLGPGSTLQLDLLTAEEVGQFDTGFGEPDGPALDLDVVGVVRLPPDVLSGTPVIASPAVAERLGDAAAGEVVFVDLVDEDGSGASFEAGATEIGAAAEPVPGREELPPLVVTDLDAGTQDARRTTQVLVAGMSAALLVGAIAAVVVMWQAFVRHHGLSASDQRVESALGSTAHERALARAVPAMTAAAVAVLVAVPFGVAASAVDPPGAVARLEPDPGWHADPAAVAIGAVVLGFAIVGLAYATARRAGVPSGHVRSARRAAPTWMPRRHGWPLLGTTFALSSGSRDGVVPTRAALGGAALGVAGVVATLTVGASLDRLVDTPARWGWNADVVVVDVTDEAIAELGTDPRVAGLTDVRSGAIDLDGASVQAYSLAPIEGAVGWTILDGRAPTGDREVLVGSREAERRGLDVGDEIAADVPAVSGEQVTLEVVGVGIGPPLGGERLGDSVALTPETLTELSPVQLFREAMVLATPGSAGSLTEDLASRYEIDVAEPPRAVRDLGEVEGLPSLLGAFLAVLAAAALLHALVVSTRRRRRDLAVLTALGGTRRQVRLVVAAMAAVTGVAGVLIGVPLGAATGRLVWGEMARRAGVAGDIARPPEILAVIVAAPLVAVVLAAWPAIRAARRDTADALRQE
jgi:putative ABC transport system permease protein